MEQQLPDLPDTGVFRNSASGCCVRAYQQLNYPHRPGLSTRHFRFVAIGTAVLRRDCTWGFFHLRATSDVERSLRHVGSLFLGPRLFLL